MLPNDIDTGVFTDEALTIITSMQQDGVMKGGLEYKPTGYPPKQDYAPFINTPKACSFTDEQDEKEFARRFRLADELNAFGELLQRILYSPIPMRNGSPYQLKKPLKPRKAKNETSQILPNRRRYRIPAYRTEQYWLPVIP